MPFSTLFKTQHQAAAHKPAYRTTRRMAFALTALVGLQLAAPLTVPPGLQASLVRRPTSVGSSGGPATLVQAAQASRLVATRGGGPVTIRRLDVPEWRRTYLFIPGQFNQASAWQTARNFGGYAVVFNSMAEHKRVVGFFDFKKIAPAWTGHFQWSGGREPGVGWMTVTGEPSAPLSQLFNGRGPDDGVRNKWGWNVTEEGFDVWYGPSDGKNEDAAVVWDDSNGQLEDVSINHKGGVIVEIPR